MGVSFSTRATITNPSDLFGRKVLFDQLLSLANNSYSVSITGLRRFGKTSLLKCVESELRGDPAAKAYPVFFDFKDVGSIIKGTDNVYKYMISRLVSTLSKDKFFEGEEIFCKKTIQASDDWKDIYENLSDVSSVRIQSIFKEIVLLFSELIQKTILFLIDEYEWLFRFSFDEPVGFMKLRSISSMSLINGISPFSFWIAGATTWDYLCTITGSGELNVIDAPPIYLKPIDYPSFQLMWQNEINKMENCNEVMKNGCEFAFQASGGVPFYGKLILSHFISSDMNPSYSILKSYFQELFDSLQNEEKLILKDLAKLPRNYKNSKYVLELLEKGLIKKNGTNYEVRIGYLKDFVMASIIPDVELKIDSEIESQKITYSITMLIMNINNTHRNKIGHYIFEPVNDDAALIKDLSTPCYSLELFQDFASSLYKIVFERTKENRGGIDINKARLPRNFKKNNQFIEIVDILRHSLGGGHLMDTFSQRPGQLSKPRMLYILVGTKNEPNTPDEFYNLQIATLKMFETELNKLNSIVRLLN